MTYIQVVGGYRYKYYRTTEVQFKYSDYTTPGARTKMKTWFCRTAETQDSRVWFTTPAPQWMTRNGVIGRQVLCDSRKRLVQPKGRLTDVHPWLSLKREGGSKRDPVLGESVESVNHNCRMMVHAYMQHVNTKEKARSKGLYCFWMWIIMRVNLSWEVKLARMCIFHWVWKKECCQWLLMITRVWSMH